MIEKLQFITQENEHVSHLECIEAACQAGVKWVQLRVKNKPLAEVKRLAEDARSICLQWGARLIINDFPQIALETGADGFHIGREDMSVEQARRFAENMIIGQTANTFEDVKQHWQNGASYVGLGPFAYTTTKEKLSPILGVEGYRQIILQCRAAGISIPIVAIGGIGIDDILPIMQTGVHGIAVSSLIARAENQRFTVGTILQLIENTSNQHAYNSQ